MFKVPLIASAIVHATIVAVAVVGGHGSGTARVATAVTMPIAILEPIAVDMVTEPVVTPPLPVNTETHPTAPAHVHSHTHDYPVPADHDDHPHDPALVHEHAVPHDDGHEASEVVALPAPAPVFNIVVGPAIAPRSGLSSSLTREPTTAHGPLAAVPSTEAVPEAFVNVPARLISSAPPVYPPRARAAEVEADVGVDLVLDAAGVVAEAKVTRAAGYGLDESALAAIRGYRFSPAQKDGRPVRVRMHWTVQFRLR
jgi:TonB family protein